MPDGCCKTRAAKGTFYIESVAIKVKLIYFFSLTHQKSNKAHLWIMAEAEVSQYASLFNILIAYNTSAALITHKPTDGAGKGSAPAAARCLEPASSSGPGMGTVASSSCRRTFITLSCSCAELKGCSSDHHFEFPT